jgi:hypothetical protein
MKTYRLKFLLVSLLLCALISPVFVFGADTDKQNLVDLLDSLDQKILKADEKMIAHPTFLDELRSLVKQYRSRIRKIFVSEDFSDGEYHTNPAWVTNSASFKINKSRRLASHIAVERPASSKASEETPTSLTEIFKDILLSTSEQKKDIETGSAERYARIYTLATIEPAFEMEFTFVSQSTWGSMEVVLLGGKQAVPWYRLIYHAAPSPERPFEILRERDGKSFTIETASQYPNLDEGLPHRIQWSRDVSGRMRVMVDGKEILSTYEIYYKDNFSGVALVNRGGTYEWGPLQVLKAQ